MSDRESQNFEACKKGFSYVGKTLQPYTENSLKDLHQRIYKQLAWLPHCTERCSEKHGGNIVKWCPTCTRWKDALKREHRFWKWIKWGRTKSWTWPHDPKNIHQIYVKSTNTDFDLRDISTLCHVWKNCVTFKVHTTVCDKALQLRNKCYGHNPNCRVSNIKKTEVFDNLKDLVNERDFKTFVDAQKCREDLSVIEKEDTVLKLLYETKKETQAIASMTTHIIEQQNIQCEHSVVDKSTDKRETVRSKWLKTWKPFLMVFSLFPVVLIIVTFLSWTLNGKEQHLNKTTRIHSECVSEVYRYPFPQDLPLIDYLDDRGVFVGRRWLFNEINEHLFSTKHDSRGVLLQAEMGYGKSAVVKRLLCADKIGIAQLIKERVVAFHVCKFDVPSTWNIGRFIRRLIGFFATYSAEFGSAISMLNEHSLIYNRDVCDKEPMACFDQGIITPLKNVNHDNPWFIVIDALDECYDPETNRNHILHVLSSRIRNFPNWLKLVVTTRDKYGQNELKGLERLYLNSSDNRNLRDIEMYIQEQALFIENRDSLPSESLREKFTNDVFRNSEGNFLFIVNALDYVMSRSKDMRADVKLPTQLKDIYEINFKRTFSNPGSYDVARLILQVICSSIHPLNTKEISDIVTMESHIDSANVSQALDSLKSFLNIREGFSIRHKSLKDWLVDKENKMYFISPKEGHSLLAKYLFHLYNANNTVDIVDLTIHVANSGNKKFKSIFKSMNISVQNDTLHNLVFRSNSGKALQLISKFIDDVDILNKAGETPAFIAAYTGNLIQLKLLVEKGANLNFTKSEIEGVFNSMFEVIKICERQYFCGYSLLHIAAKSGHINVVEYLLKTNEFLIKLSTTTGNNIIDLACEAGHLFVIKHIFAFNKTLLGERCIYLAAKNGHGHVIDFYHKSKDTKLECINDTKSLEAYKSSNALNGSVLYKKDVWWLVFKETPLHVAVRFGRYSSVMEIVKSQRQLLLCHDAFGRTPYLASIWYNRTEIFKYLLKHVAHQDEKCSDNRPSYISEITFMANFIASKSCPLGASFAHLVANFDRFDMIVHTAREKVATNWSAVDFNLDTADHYAARAGSLYYLILALDHNYFRRNINEIRGSNGSTVYHIAALSAQKISFAVFKRNFRIPNLFDTQNRSVMQYLALRKQDNKSLESQFDTLAIFQELIIDGHSLYHMDSFGRNVLHYVLLNGYSVLVNQIYSYHKHAWNELLYHKDHSGLTPLIYSLINNLDKTSFLDMECLLSEKCNLRYMPVDMEMWEKTLAHVIQLEKSSVLIPQEYILHFFRKSPFLTKTMLVFSDLKDRALKQKLFDILREERNLTDIVGISLSILYVHKPNIFHACYKNLEESPIHKIFKNIQYIGSTMINVIESRIKKDLYSKYINCPDHNGYNIFHYALMGGNIVEAHLLMNLNIRVSTENVNHEEILWMVLVPPSQGDMLIKDCTNNKSSIIDIFLKSFIEKFSRHFTTGTFCKDNALDFSLAHVISLNGLATTLQTIAENYGQGVLSCRNRDGFNPRYLWLMTWGHTDFMNLPLRELTNEVPNSKAEETFLHKLLYNFTQVNVPTSPLHCLCRWKRLTWVKIHSRVIYKQAQCLSVTLKEMKFMSLEMFKETLSHGALVDIITLYIRSITLNFSAISKLNWFHADTIHSVYLKIYKIFTEEEKNYLSNKWKISMRKLDKLNVLFLKLNKALASPLLRPNVKDIKRLLITNIIVVEDVFYRIAERVIQLHFINKKSIRFQFQFIRNNYFLERLEKLGFINSPWKIITFKFYERKIYDKYKYLDILKRVARFRYIYPSQTFTYIINL